MLLAVFGMLKPKGNAMQRFQQKMLLKSILMEMKKEKNLAAFTGIVGFLYFFL